VELSFQRVINRTLPIIIVLILDNYHDFSNSFNKKLKMCSILDRSQVCLHYNYSMQKKWDILGIGTAAVDDHYTVDRFPQPDEKIPVHSIHRYAGGQTATALVAASRQGASTAFFSRLGDDELSRFTIAELEKEGVDCSLIANSPGSRPFFALVIVDAMAATRTILFSADGVDEPNMDRFDSAWIEQSRVVFIDHNIPFGILHASRLAHEARVPVIADLESTTIPVLPELLPLVDHLIVSRSFASRLAGSSSIADMLTALSPSTRSATVITCGEKGCWYQTPECPIKHISAFQVKVMDTTGCGDIFHGTYAAAIARGESIDRAILIATASAGMKAAQIGGRAGIPNLEQVEEFLRDTIP
jgi:sulfofructose kinase